MPTLLLTRPRTSAENFVKAAAWAGDVVISPLIEVVLRPIAPPAPGEGVIFTSQHGVRAVAAVTGVRDAPVWCVGPGTFAAAQAAGFATLHQGGGTAESLIAELAAAPPDCPLVHVHGAHVVTDLAGRLMDAGLRARGVVGYDQHERPLSDAARQCLLRQGHVVVPVFSPRSAKLFARAWEELGAPLAQLHALAISAAAAQALGQVPLASLTIAHSPDLPGVLGALGQVQATLEPDQNPR
ncbi:uroporphyrinogen-III synthase [Roseibaca sp. Y0-43]|uniref:uroporphyrinogen-III synthase n=1 Tax=Roseibaca sp. Y0-43 TaxID=2816854 RepID=UPI001D0C1135|nr:uroporphyrinogen-III synthase [Roseibaca sp. Y0-43]MCC1481429.1 uroporphyrinogen-III synthase [Roseibaca sp. Y0-43]